MKFSCFFKLFANLIQQQSVVKKERGVRSLSTLRNAFFVRIFRVNMVYADDTVLFAETSDDLQHALNVFANFCKNWKLTVNIEKTKKK